MQKHYFRKQIAKAPCCGIAAGTCAMRSYHLPLLALLGHCGVYQDFLM